MMVKILFALMALLIATGSCSGPDAGEDKTAYAAAADRSTKAYQLDKPIKTWQLPDPLVEISGISWLDAGHLVAIEDLTPNLYLLRLSGGSPVERTIPFRQADGSKFDVEDVALSGGTAYALWSHGSIFELRNWQSGKPDVRELETGLSKKNNTEGLCFDPVSGNLLIACKDKSGLDDAKKSARSIYAFDLRKGALLPDPFLVIDHKEIKKVTGEKAGFHPSAIAVHPVTKQIYVLSTRDTKGLACFDRQGKLVSFAAINADLMPQPEGLTFAPDGTLYISTQGRGGKPAQVLAFAAP